VRRLPLAALPLAGLLHRQAPTRMETLWLRLRRKRHRPLAKLRRMRRNRPRAPTAARLTDRVPRAAPTRRIKKSRAARRRRDCARSFPG